MLLNSSKPTALKAPEPQRQVTETQGEGGASKAPKRPFWRTTGIAVGIIAWTYFGFMLAQAIGIGAVYGLQWAGVPLQDLNPVIFNTVANIITYSLAILIIIGVPWWIKKNKTTLADVGLNRLPVWKDFLWLFAGVFAYLILTLVVTAISRLLIPDANYDQAQETGFNGITSQLEYVLTFISLVLVAPIAEEVIFRGYLFGKLRNYVKVWLAIVLSAVLFAVAHGQFNVALDTFALGVVLALLRVTTGSIWASILLHMLKNGVAFYFLFVNPLVL